MYKDWISGINRYNLKCIKHSTQNAKHSVKLDVADVYYSLYSWSWHVQCFVLVLYFSVSSLLSLQFSLLRAGCVSAWRPPKVVPTTCCSLRFIAISSSDALSARHAKTAGSGPEWGAKRRGKEGKETPEPDLVIFVYSE